MSRILVVDDMQCVIEVVEVVVVHVEVECSTRTPRRAQATCRHALRFLQVHGVHDLVLAPHVSSIRPLDVIGEMIPRLVQHYDNRDVVYCSSPKIMDEFDLIPLKVLRDKRNPVSVLTQSALLI